MTTNAVRKQQFILLLILPFFINCKSSLVFNGNQQGVNQTTIISDCDIKKVFAGFDIQSGSEDLNNPIASCSKGNLVFGPVSHDRMDYGGFVVLTKDNIGMFGVEFFWFSHDGKLKKGVSSYRSKNRLKVYWLTENSFLITEKNNRKSNWIIKLNKSDSQPQFTETNY